MKIKFSSSPSKHIHGFQGLVRCRVYFISRDGSGSYSWYWFYVVENVPVSGVSILIKVPTFILNKPLDNQ